MISEIEQDMLAKSVAQGAALLDEKKPKWAHKIRLEQLEMCLCSRCVLGQLFRDFTGGYMKLGLAGEEVDEHGFDLNGELMVAHSGNIEPLWRLLDKLWTEEVNRRVS